MALSDLHNTSTERAETAELVNDENRSTTIDWLMTEYVDKYDLDGIDIDFEDATLDSNYMGPYYSNFIKDLALALHDGSVRGRKKICTATLSGNDYNRSVVTSDFIGSIDMLGIQTYSADKIYYTRYNSNRNMITHYNNWKGGYNVSKCAAISS